MSLTETTTTRLRDNDSARHFAGVYEALRTSVESAVRGKPDAVRLALTCLFAGGHLLIEDVPGVGKTSLAKAIAASVDGSWHRIQFTPDLLPSDITGTSVFDQRTGTFEFRAGPVFAHLVLADEINRASPKTQSALLEVMAERQITVDGRTHPVPEPFLVVATQNPIDLEGTYRLPEAQLDRFLLRIAIGYPDLAEEEDILLERSMVAAPELTPVTSPSAVAWMCHYARAVHVAPEIARYVAALARDTRGRDELRLGASTRASIALVRAAQAWAATDGRQYVIPDDVKDVAGPVLSHRLLLEPDAELRGVRVDSVLTDVLRSVPAPSYVGR
jgi:MoxR-like ATPase